MEEFSPDKLKMAAGSVIGAMRENRGDIKTTRAFLQQSKDIAEEMRDGLTITAVTQLLSDLNEKQLDSNPATVARKINKKYQF